MNMHVAIEMPTLVDVPLVMLRCVDRDERLHSLLTQDAPLTAAEWAYINAAEAAVGGDDRG